MENHESSDWKPPIYVLLDLISNKPIGYYGITEGDRMELEADLYLSNNPHLSRRDIGAVIDRYGYSAPLVNQIDEFL